MSDLTLRPAAEADIPTLVDIEVRAFNRDDEAHRQQVGQEVHHGLGHYVVLLRGDETVGCARIGRDWLRVGSCQVLKGDVGHVAIRPELHGQGLGTEMMQRVITHMREHGFHLSRLGGLMKFYARFGYEPFIRRYVHIPAPRLDDNMKGEIWRDRLGVPDPNATFVRPYHPTLDHEAVHRLRYRFSARRSGQIVMNPEPSSPGGGEPDPDGLLFVYDDGEVRGWLQGGLGLVHAGETEPSYRIDDFACDRACPEAVGALVKALIERAQDRAPTTLVCRLPYDEDLFIALNAANLPFEAVEMRTAVDGNMMQVVNLSATLAVVAPELSERLEGTPTWQGRIRFVLPGQMATLEVSPDAVHVVDDASLDLEIRASQADFIKWLFGIVGFAESSQAAALTPAQRQMLSLLFPRCPCASGPWG